MVRVGLIAAVDDDDAQAILWGCPKDLEDCLLIVLPSGPDLSVLDSRISDGWAYVENAVLRDLGDFRLDRFVFTPRAMRLPARTRMQIRADLSPHVDEGFEQEKFPDHLWY